MKWLHDSLERRSGARVRTTRPRASRARRRQVVCNLLVDGRVFRGILSDVSARGFFVRTELELPEGEGAIVSFLTPAGERVVCEAYVPRESPVAQSLSRAARHGVALHVPHPPEAYLRWVRREEAQAAS